MTKAQNMKTTKLEHETSYMKILQHTKLNRETTGETETERTRDAAMEHN